MKTDKEIKEWIDGREAVCKTELQRFIYGYVTGRYSTKLMEWWGYVLNTKNWETLKSHPKLKQLNANRNMELFNRVKDIWNNDPRMKTVGYRTVKKYLQNIYQIDIPSTTTHRYIQEFKKQQNELV